MSFANKPNRPDSRDTARLRAEYQKKVTEFRDSGDPASKAKLKDEKQKLFQRVVDQVNHERKEELSSVQKSLAKLGKFKTDEQLAAERANVEASRASRLDRESR